MSYIRHNGFGDYEPSANQVMWPFGPTASSGDCGCGCGGGGGCGGHDHGMGLFESMDPTTWGAGEWTVASVGSYLAISAFHDAMSAGRVVKKHATKQTSVGSIIGLAALAGGAYYLWSKTQSTGLSGYMPQGFATPQILVDPTRTADIQIPMGW